MFLNITINHSIILTLMSCSNPKKAFIVGKKPNGKNDIVICSYKVHHLELTKGKYEKSYSEFISKRCEKPIYEYIEIPCGKCQYCRLEHAKTWANRVILEMKDYEDNYFVTITYNDKYMPYIQSVDENTGEINELKTLQKRDLQLFLKRLRKKFNNQKIRFFACGEYSPKGRPHYHLIIFNLKLEDLKPYGKNKDLKDCIYFESESLNKCWTDVSSKESKGFICVAPATYETAFYTARYVLKKCNYNYGNFFKNNSLEKEFITMSRNPGIARNYYDNHKDIFDFNNIVVSTNKGGIKFVQPRYFTKLLEIEDPIKAQEIKDKRIDFAKERIKQKQLVTDKDYLDMLVDEDIVLKKKTRVYARKGVE